MSAERQDLDEGQTRALAYQRALGKLSRLHHDEFADLVAAERSRVGMALEQRKAKHGTHSKYARGCRCARCRQATACYHRRLRARRKANTDRHREYRRRCREAECAGEVA